VRESRHLVCSAGYIAEEESMPEWVNELLDSIATASGATRATAPRQYPSAVGYAGELMNYEARRDQYLAHVRECDECGVTIRMMDGEVGNHTYPATANLCSVASGLLRRIEELLEAPAGCREQRCLDRDPIAAPPGFLSEPRR
jgi:hypothetical protein